MGEMRQALKLYFGGDMEASIALSGQVCGRINSIEPVADIYRELGIKTLLIAAEGAVRYLPFAALYDGERFLAETTATALLTEAVPYAAAPRTAS